MPKISVSNASGVALDWMVAIAKGVHPSDILVTPTRLYRRMRDEEGHLTGSYMTGPEFLFHKMWESGGPIIDREGICLKSEARDHSLWLAQFAYTKEVLRLPNARLVHSYCLQRGPTPLIAAMRCYVASKLGDEVEVPEELLSCAHA